MIELTGEQGRAVRTRAARALVVACPGSGKTLTIIQRVIWLVAGGADPRYIAVVTYTNAAARVVEQRLAEIGIEVGFVGTLHSFCHRHLSKFGPWTDLRVMDEEDADALLAQIARDVAPQASWRELVDCRTRWPERERSPAMPTEIAVARYYAEMAKLGEVDYDTLLRWTLKFLREPSQPRTRWDHLIVDEYQDAARIDAEIYAAATADNRFYVGDPMQSIFAFRGASVSEIKRLQVDPKWEKHQLTVNFRSLPKICEALTNLAKHGAAIQSIVRSHADAGGDVKLRYFDDETEEAEGIASAIQHQVEQVGPPLLPGEDGFEGRTQDITEAAEGFAVLARTNWIADKIADEMKRKGVPVRQLRRVDQPEDWKLAVAALGVLARPRSAAALRRYNARRKSKMAAAGPLTGYANRMGQELEALGVGDASRALIMKRFGELPQSADLIDLETSLALDPVNRQMEGEGCFVGTIHAAKGAEWDHVIIAGFEAELLPGTRKGNDVAEERRLAYVGISRARQTVVLTWACYRQRYTHGGMRPGYVSPFAEEAGIR